MMSLPTAMRSLLLNQPTERVCIPGQPEGTTIPRITHHPRRNRDALPTDVCDRIAALPARNPGWEYRFYGDESVTRFIRDSNGPAVPSYFEGGERRYGAAQADLFRDNADHKSPQGRAHHTVLTVPVVSARQLRRALPVLYRMFDAGRCQRQASGGQPQ